MQKITIGFAHPAYQLANQFGLRDTGMDNFQVWDYESLQDRISACDVLVVSGLWRDELIERAPNLKFVQSISAGINQYGQDRFRQAGIRLASAAGVNANAVSEHAMALILALARLLHTARDHQHQKHFRGLISDLGKREDELGGKTLCIVGLGRIGQRLAKLAKAFDMHVIGTKRNTAVDLPQVDELYSSHQLPEIVGRADFLALTCPLTPETENLVDQKLLDRMQPSSYLINVARGAVVDELALIEALTTGKIAGAGLDTFVDEPLPQASALWEMENVILTPHAAGETRKYEDNVIDILLENLSRLENGEPLVNQVI